MRRFENLHSTVLGLALGVFCAFFSQWLLAPSAPSSRFALDYVSLPETRQAREEIRELGQKLSLHLNPKQGSQVMIASPLQVKD